MKHNKRIMPIINTLFLIFSITLINADKVKEIDSLVINTMEDVVKAGTYFVEAAIDDDDGNKIPRLVRIHVKYPKTVLDYGKEDGIDAHDIIVEPNTIQAYTEEQLKIKGGAHAWSMDTGKEIQVAKSELKDSSKDFAINDVRYATDKDVATTISVYTQDEINLKFDQVYVTHKSVLIVHFCFYHYYLSYSHYYRSLPIYCCSFTYRIDTKRLMNFFIMKKYK